MNTIELNLDLPVIKVLLLCGAACQRYAGFILNFCKHTVGVTKIDLNLKLEFQDPH